MWKATGVQPPELAAVGPAPQEFLYLWVWLKDLIHPLSFSDLEAWGRLTGKVLAHWEIEVMIRLDRARS